MQCHVIHIWQFADFESPVFFFFYSLPNHICINCSMFAYIICRPVLRQMQIRTCEFQPQILLELAVKIGA
jgi:hypothetical protein